MASIFDACCGMILIEGDDVIHDVFHVKPASERCE